MLMKATQISDEQGSLKVNVTDERNIPITQAGVTIFDQNGNEIANLLTDMSGQTDELELEAPDANISLNEDSTEKPYAKYDIEISAPGYETARINGSEILSTTLSFQIIKLRSANTTSVEEINIEEHNLYQDYPEKIREDEIKQINEPGEIVLSRVVVPEYVVVHDGSPDSNAKDYYVTYKDYIKNVASSEIYATWPRAAIEANVLVIMSFTLNRVYTEWYRNRGKNYTITSSTAYDQKWIYGRNIYKTISDIVDSIFNQYLSRPDVRQPILTQYCDGRRVSCPNWLSQWGSCDLAQRGYSTIEILRYYYGNSIYINKAEQISGIPSSWPGYNLTVGSTGQKVEQIQQQLATISRVYSAIPRISADGIYGERTRQAVSRFQEVFSMPVTGIVDFATWYQISQIYVGITRIAEN